MSVHQSVILFTGSGPGSPSAQDPGRGLPDMFKLVKLGPYCTGSQPSRHIQTCLPRSFDCQKEGGWPSTEMLSV